MVQSPVFSINDTPKSKGLEVKIRSAKNEIRKEKYQIRKSEIRKAHFKLSAFYHPLLIIRLLHGHCSY